MFRKLSEKIKIQLQDPELDDYKSLNDKKKSILLKIFFFLMGALILFFLVVSLFEQDYFHIIIDSSVFAVLTIFYLLFRARKHLLLSTHFFVLIFCSIALFYALSGGNGNTGLLIIVLLPIPVIMLMGRKAGLIVLSVFFLIILVIYFFFNGASWLANYTFDFILRVFICFIIITVLGYLNESVFNILYSRLQKTADSLLESRENFKSLSMNREKFLSIISHDLKNQIAGFYSATDLLKNHYQEMNEEERMEIVDLLWENSQKNVRLLQDLLKWSMIKNNTFPYNPINIKLERIYKEVVELFDLEIEKNNISIFLKMRSNSEVFADFDMLSAIMRNLVSNAIRYVGKDGEIRIKSEEKGDYMNVEVRDNGPGIDSLTLENLKQSLSASTIGIANEHGTGLGLLLVKEFVETNKGEFLIESQKNKGTRISFTVPLTE